MSRLARAGVALLRRSRHEEGQVLVLVAVCMVAFIGVAGLVIDVGQEHISQQRLTIAANAAALAAAEYLPNSSATATACTYSGSLAQDLCNVTPQATDGFNSYSGVPGVTTTTQLECISAASAGTNCATGTACPAGVYFPPYGTANNVAGCNAIKVTESMTVHPWFMGVLGFAGQRVTATATAASAGGVPHPLNIEIIDDTTGSMNNTDTCGGTPTDVPNNVPLNQEDCAKAGIRALLTTLLPCSPSLSSCGPATTGTNGGSNVANPVDEVGLVAFPGLNSSVYPFNQAVSKELDCVTNINGSDRTYATASPAANYQIVPFSSDFRLSDTPTSDPLATLNTMSNLVRSVYWPGDFCPNGGYPVNTGGPTSSISGGGSGTANSSSATNSGAAIGGGAAAANNSSSTAEGGVVQGQSAGSTNADGISRGSTSGATSTALTIGGGPHSGSSSDTRTTSVTAATGITVTRPLNRAANDFLLLTVTAQGAAITGTTNICPNAATTGWTLVDQNRLSGTVLQETWSSTRATAASETYTFNFFTTGTCAADTGTGNQALNASSTALRYTNVASVGPVAGATGAPSTANFAGSAPSTAWSGGGNTTYTHSISSQRWSGGSDWFTSVSADCSSQNQGDCDTTPVAGTITSATFSFAGAISGSASYTVTLYKNDNPTASSCTINGGGQTCTIGGLSLAVSGSDQIVLDVVRNSGPSYTGSATATAIDSPGATPHYVSLHSACVNASATLCDDATIVSTGTLTSASLTFGAAVPSGDTFTVTLFRNGVATGSTCPITSVTTGHTCSVAPTGIALNATDLVELQVTRTAGTTAFTTTATTALAEGYSTLTAPSVTTVQTNDQIVRLFGTGSTSFVAGSTSPGAGTLPLTVSSNSTATGADDANQAAAGASGTESVTSTTPATWAAQTVVLIPALPSSITVSPPAGYLAGNLLLVSIAVQGLGSGVICAPAAAPTWNAAITKTSGSGATQLTQETFWTMSGAPGYTFNFMTACSGGTAIAAGASEVAVAYTGVDPTAPLDTVTPQAASGTTSPLVPASVTTQSVSDEVVTLFATNAAALTVPAGGVNQNGTSTSSGFADLLQQVPRAVTFTGANNATSAPTAANWAEETIALRPALPTAITVTQPPDYTPGTGAVLLVSVAAQNLGGGSICSPGSNWHLLGTTTSGSGATQITQASFWTTLGNSFTFTFYPSSACTGTPVGAAASTVATTYTGADVTGTPLFSTTSNPAPATTLTAPQLATTSANSEVVSFFASNAAFNGTQPTVVSSSAWTNTGADSTAQVAVGNQATPFTATTATSANWSAQTIALVPLLSPSITITPPSAYVGGGANFLLVSVSAQNLGSATICPPDSTWTPVPVSAGPTTYTVKSGTVTSEAFWTTSSVASSDTFSFNQNASCAGNQVNVGASAVAVNYTGVNPTSPLDGIAVPAQGTTSPLAPGQITTTKAGDEVVGLFGTAAGTLGGATVASTGGVTTNSGVNNTLAGAAGPYTPASATSNPAAASWTAETLALQPLGTTGIDIARPPTPAASDFLLVTLTATGLTGAGNSICAPNDSTWTQLGTLITQGTITQATFYGFRPSANAENYAFTFRSGACPSGGTTLSAPATAIAVRYAGVNPITPIDMNSLAQNVYASSKGSGTTIAPPAVTPQHSGDEVVAFYGTAAASMTLTGSANSTTGNAPASGYWDVNAPAAGSPSTPHTATTTTNNWIGQTVALEAAAGACNNCNYGVEVSGPTNYGMAIQAAETNLEALAVTRPTAQKVIILLSDGDGNTATSNPCEFGLAQAENAESHGTWVFTIAYGAYYDQSGSVQGQNKSCTQDINPTQANYITGIGGTSSNNLGLSAQCAMILMANNSVSNPQSAANPNGYATDQAAKAALCDSPANTFSPSDPTHRYYNQAIDTSLESVFQGIGNALTSPRLLSDNAT